VAMDMVSSTSCSLLREKPDRMHASTDLDLILINYYNPGFVFLSLFILSYLWTFFMYGILL